MATLTFYQPAKMLDPQGFFGEIHWEVAWALPNSIRLNEYGRSDWSDQITYFGYFTYAASGDILSGNITRIEVDDSFLEFNVAEVKWESADRYYVAENLNIPVLDLASLLEIGNVQGAVSLLMSEDDVIYGSKYDDTLVGWSGNDIIHGNAGDDVLYGFSGNDTLVGGSGNDYLLGGEGIDYALFTGLRNHYTIAELSDGWVEVSDLISNRDGKDSLLGVERLQFADINVALDLGGTAGQAYRIYEAVLGRAPDLEGLGYWINDMDNGVSLTTIAKGFIASPEFQNKYGVNPSYETYVNLLYNNILDRDPDPVGMNYWVSNMRNGVDSPAAVLASFSEGYENTANVAPDISNGIFYTPWII